MSAFVLSNLLERANQQWPDQVALVMAGAKSGVAELSYRDLYKRSVLVASALSAKGVAVGDPVALCIDKSIEAVVGLFGILLCGGCYVPVDPFQPSERIAQIIGGAKPRVVLARADRTVEVASLLEACPHSPTVATVEALEVEGATTEAGPLAQPLGAADNHLAYILHTSGSTGVPKGVALSHRAALTFVEMAFAYFEVRPEDRFAAHAPLTFDLSVFDIFVAVRAGATIVLLPEFLSAFPAKLIKTIAAQRITIWNSVVSALSLMLDRGKLSADALPDVRACIFSGEKMPMRVLRGVRAAMPKAALYNVYGQTEANSSMVFPVKVVPDADDAELPIGRAFPNFDVFAMTEAGARVRSPGEVGELYVRSASVATGYYRDPVRSAERFVPDPRFEPPSPLVYRTGDLVRLDDSGDYCFVGRVDHLVKVRGYRVELSEIELVLTADPTVAEAAVVAIADETTGHRLLAFASGKDDQALDGVALRQRCMDRLPKYMVPDCVFVRPELPHSTTGKIDRRALRALGQSLEAESKATQ